MLYIKRQMSLPVGSAWVTMPPLRLGNVPSGLGTAGLFVTIEDDDAPAGIRGFRGGDESREPRSHDDDIRFGPRLSRHARVGEGGM